MIWFKQSYNGTVITRLLIQQYTDGRSDNYKKQKSYKQSTFLTDVTSAIIKLQASPYHCLRSAYYLFYFNKPVFCSS